MSKKIFPMGIQSILLIFLIPLILMLVWFRNGNILAFAEGGLLFENVEIHAQITKYAWAEQALGNSTGIVTASYPTYVVLNFIEKLGFQAYVVEAMFFYILFVTAGLGIYFFTKLLFSELPDKYILLTILFYWFNPFAMINIWHRFLYNYMVFYSFLPIVSYFFVKGINTRNYGYSFIVAILSGLFSYSLTSTPFNFLLWLVLMYFSIFYLITSNETTIRIFILNFFLISFGLYLGINSWWISQLISFIGTSNYETTVSSFFNQNNNLATLDILSNKLGKLSDTLRLYHGDFFSNTEFGWVEIYRNPILMLLSYVFPLTGLLSLYLRRSKSVLLLILLFALGLFLTKGNSPPFGEFFEFFFAKLPLLQIFRNPFEKFGFLLPLSLSPLIGYGLYLLIYKKFYEKWILILSFCLMTVFYGFPFFSGSIFDIGKDWKFLRSFFEVKVPDYYQQMNEYLNNDPSLFRIMMMPLGDEGVTHQWEKGYMGVEVSSTLFEKPSISFNTTIPYFYEMTKGIQLQFLTNARFNELANRLNIKYFIVRHDLDFIARQMYDPKQIVEELKSKPNDYSKLTEFGKLELWENKQYINSFSLLSSVVVSSNSSTDIADLTLKESPSTAVMVDERVIDKIGFTPSLVIVNSTREYFFPDLSKEGFKMDPKVFPYVSTLPGSFKHQILLEKERIEILSLFLSEKKLSRELFYLGKRLSELKQLKKTYDNEVQIIPLTLYSEQLSQFQKDYYQLKARDPLQIKQWDEYARKILDNHQSLLKELAKSKSDPISKVLLKLVEDIRIFSGESGINPRFIPKDATEFPINNRRVFQYFVNKGGSYELIVPVIGNIANNQVEIMIQVDDLLENRQMVNREDGFYSLGNFDLSSGLHEIRINDLLIPQKFSLIESNDDQEEERLLIENFDPNYQYLLSYQIKDVFKDLVKIELKNYISYQEFKGTEVSRNQTKNNSTSSIEITLNPIPKSIKGEIVFSFPDQIIGMKDISNIKVSKVIPVKPKLLLKNEAKIVFFPKVEVRRINPTKYILDVPQTSEKSILVLSQLFSSGWTLKDEQNQQIKDHFLANGYANGWVLPPGGVRQLTAYYEPQNVLEKTMVFSAGSFALSLIIGGYLLWKSRK